VLTSASPCCAHKELARLRAEVEDKDALLTAMQKTLKHNAMHVDELMQASKEVSQR
jgi:hypothetical protein